MRKLTNKRKKYLDRKSVWSVQIKSAKCLRRAIWLKSRRRKFKKLKKDSAKRSDLLRMIGDCYSDWVYPQTQIRLKIPKQFSIIESPKETLIYLLKLAKMGHLRPTSMRSIVEINQQNMLNYDLAASAILAMIAMEMMSEVRSGTMPDIDFQGSVPDDENVCRFIRATGLPKKLGIASQELSKKQLAKLEIFEERVQKKKSYGSADLVEERERVAQSFVDHVDSCLVKRNNTTLTEEGRGYLLLCLAELINNAEEHAGMTDWSLHGYLDYAQDNGVFEVAMINFGHSMAQTFMNLETDSFAWKQVEKYLRLHQSRRFFGESWRVEDLLTVVALQPHVSSKGSADDTRGAGTVQLLEFFNMVDEFCNGVGQHSAKMAILSGSTHIYFDGTYQLANVGEKRAIAFNDKNDLSLKPDSKYISSMGNLHFPGTIISIKFPMPKGMTTENGNG